MNSTWIIHPNEEGEKLVDPKSEEKFGEYSSIFEFIQKIYKNSLLCTR